MISTNIQKAKDSKLEEYFNQFRDNIVGIDLEFESPYGTQKIVYTDWTASGRLYKPIEKKLLNDFALSLQYPKLKDGLESLVMGNKTK